jgi:large subunit ribosomal protein L6
MSRIGKQPIEIPKDVSASVEVDRVTVRGPKGELVVALPDGVTVSDAEGGLQVSVRRPHAKQDRSRWGLIARLIQNAVVGVSSGFERKLEVHGVGYRVALNGSTLEFQLGYSHPVRYEVPDDLAVAVEKNGITVSGANNQRVGQIAAEIRSLRKPDAYHGKGVRYSGEVLKLKPGKAVKGA